MAILRSIGRRLAGVAFMSALLASFHTHAVAATEAPPDIAVFLAKLDLAKATVSDARNITPGKGANFQPSFVLDGSAVLFVSQRTGSTNIYRYDIASGKTTAVTDTKESLYSPTPLADGSGFSAIRVVNADPDYGVESKEPAVWRFGWDGKPMAAVIDTRRVGYHAWIDDQQLAMFIVDDVPDRNAHKAILANRVTGKVTVLTDKPGSSFSRTPDGKRATFVDKSDPKRWVVAAMGAGDAKPQVLVDTVVGPEGEQESQRSHYFAWLPDGSMLMANGTRFFRWNGTAGSSFKLFADLGKLGGSIRNIAVSKDGRTLAFSLMMDAPSN